MEVLANGTMVIILQYISGSNLHLKLIQCYMSIITQWKKKKKEVKRTLLDALFIRFSWGAVISQRTIVQIFKQKELDWRKRNTKNKIKKAKRNKKEL